MQYTKAGVYFHTSCSYGCAALMGGFVKNFAHMMNAFWSIPVPIIGTFFKVYLHLG